MKALLRLPIGVAALLLQSGCTAQLEDTQQNLLNYGGPLNFRMPVASMLERRFATVVRQQYDFSCGSAALATLLRFHYDDPQNEQSVFLGMWREGDKAQIRKLGFSLLDMKRYLAGRGITADGYKVTTAGKVDRKRWSARKYLPVRCRSGHVPAGKLSHKQQRRTVHLPG